MDAVLVSRIRERRLGLGQTLGEFGRTDARHALHRGHRNGEVGFAYAHQDGLGDGQGERQAQHEGGALARLRFDGQRTAELLDLVRHHVHAHAAAGELGDLAGGGEARLGDQRKQLVVAEPGVGTQQTTLDAALADRIAIQAAAVVADAHDHFGRLARHADAHRTFGRLAGLAAFCRRLNAVGHGVAQHVLERCLDAVEQVAIHFAMCALHIQLRALALFLGRLTQRAAQVRHHRVERQHARAQQAVLQLGADTRLLDQQRLGLTRQVVEHALNRHQVGYRFGQRARILLQLRETIEFERVEYRQTAPRGARAGSAR